MICLLAMMLAGGVAVALLRTPKQVPCEFHHVENSSFVTRLPVQNVSGERKSDFVSNSSNKYQNLQDLLEDRSWQYDPVTEYHLFIQVLILSCFFEMVKNPIFGFADGSAMFTLREEGRDVSEYGDTRGWGFAAKDMRYARVVKILI